ncbi:hypothetical protein N3K66_003129 [Trichothecium roseum]|uniref:Uncharacterized protein n=1 Tax=Trichothecium roseum TaxID=47278 RepID=A0ACC0V756_9HYPO|nr:hypothetical protein N3K66_003129 [Trichothecium roseum]
MTTTQTPTANNPLSLPPTLSPDAIDALTDLTTTLTRVRAGLLSSPGAVPDPTATTTTTTTTTAATSSGSAPSGGTGPNSTDTSGASGTGTATTGTLSLVDFPGATDGVKHKVQKARAQIRQLPDMARTTAEQDDELRRLEDRVRRQREVLAGLRDAGVRFARGAAEGEGEIVGDGSNQKLA